MSKKRQQTKPKKNKTVPAMEQPKEKGPSVRQPETIKPKPKTVNKTMLGWAIFVFVVVAAVTLLILAHNGVFPGKDAPLKGEIKVDDYSTIEVLKTDAEVSDDDVEAQVNSILSSEAATEEVTEGTAELGDTINIDYAGRYADTQEAFDGGTAQGQSLTLGSGLMIDGFEDGLVGQAIGSTVTLHLTFPEDYHAEELKGKDADFDVTINSKTATITPELTDDFVKEHGAEYVKKAVSTVDEFKAALKEESAQSKVDNAIFSALKEKATVESYDEDLLLELSSYVQAMANENAKNFGMSIEQYATAFGYETLNDYLDAQSKEYLDDMMLVDKIAQQENIKWTGKQLDAALEEYLQEAGETELTVAEVKETASDIWMLIFKNTEFKKKLVLEKLRDRVKFVDEKTEPAAEENTEGTEEDAEDTASEDADTSQTKENTEEKPDETAEIGNEIVINGIPSSETSVRPNTTVEK